MGHSEYAAALVFRPKRCAYSAIASKKPTTNGLLIPASSDCQCVALVLVELA